MRRLGVWGLAAALLLGWSSVAMAAHDDSGDDADVKPAAKESSGWFSHWFGLGKSSTPARKTDTDKEKTKDKPAKLHRAEARPQDDGASVRVREEAALLRRMSVCDKLRQVAEQTNDAELHKLADQLDERALQVYYQRIADLPASHADLDLDEKGSEKHWDQNEVGAAGMPAVPHTVSAQSLHSSRSAGRED